MRKRLASLLLLLALLSPQRDALGQAAPESAPVESVDGDEVPSSEATPVAGLELHAWIAAFREADPVPRDAALRRSLAGTAVEQSKNPQGIDLSLDLGADGGLWAWTSGAPALGQGGLNLQQGTVSGRDAQGRRWEVGASARLGLPGTTGLGGSSAAVSGAFYANVAGNKGGELHQLEARYLALDEAGAAASERHVLRRRCWLGVDLYLLAWNLQEQATALEEFLATRERNQAQTERDYRRGMVTRLDSLTAQSDLLRARRRHEALLGRLQAALASLSSFLETPAQALVDPTEALEALLPATGEAPALLADHPALDAWEQGRQARLAESDWVEQNYKAQVELGPEIQFTSRSHQLDPTTAQSTDLLNLSGGVGVHVTAPLNAPSKHYQQSLLRERAELSQAGSDETRRALQERRLVALTQVESSGRSSALVAEQLALIDKQVAAAWARFLDGRLEYQDYLLHYTQYEEARLAVLQLALEALQARIELAELTSDLPEICQ